MEIFERIREWFNREPVSLDTLDNVAIAIPCPPAHGPNCRCTWY